MERILKWKAVRLPVEILVRFDERTRTFLPSGKSVSIRIIFTHSLTLN